MLFTKMIIVPDFITNIKIVKNDTLILDKDYAREDSANAIFNYFKELTVNEVIIAVKCLTKDFSGFQVSTGYYCSEKDIRFIERMFRDNCTGSLYVCNLYDCVKEGEIIVDTYGDLFSVSFRKEGKLNSLLSNYSSLNSFCSKIYKYLGSPSVSYLPDNYWQTVSTTLLLCSLGQQNGDVEKTTTTATALPHEVPLPILEEKSSIKSKDASELLSSNSSDSSRSLSKKSEDIIGKNNNKFTVKYGLITMLLLFVSIILMFVNLNIYKKQYKLSLLKVEYDSILDKLTESVLQSEDYIKSSQSPAIKEMVSEISAMLEKFPDYIEINFGKVEILYKVSDEDEAIKYLEKINSKFEVYSFSTSTRKQMEETSTLFAVFTINTF